MNVFAISHKNAAVCCVASGENRTDAVLRYYKEWAGDDRYDEEYEEAGSGNELAEQVLAEVFDCYEIEHFAALEYVKQRLNGADISIIL